MSRSEYVVSREWEQLEASTTRSSAFQSAHPVHIPSDAEIRLNRYSNVLPVEATRVLLRAPAPRTYINANWIQHAATGVTYIATQAPVPASIEDFWWMVLQTNASVIVMLTQLTDIAASGHRTIKAHQYWPDAPGEEWTVSQNPASDQVVVRLVGEQRHDLNLVVRSIDVCHDGTVRRVHQLHYTGWPDFGTPAQSKQSLASFTRFYEVYSAYLHTNPTPTVVAHCSAGIGRTGVLLSIDILRRNPSANIREVVTCLRTHRAGMVQTEAQFAFIAEFAAAL